MKSNNGNGKLIAVTRGKGFQLKFDNGWTASVQFGRSNYCGNRYDESKVISREYYGDTCAECFAWDGNARAPNRKEIGPFGYQSANEVARFLARVAARKAS